MGDKAPKTPHYWQKEGQSCCHVFGSSHKCCILGEQGNTLSININTCDEVLEEGPRTEELHEQAEMDLEGCYTTILSQPRSGNMIPGDAGGIIKNFGYMEEYYEDNDDEGKDQLHLDVSMEAKPLSPKVRCSQKKTLCRHKTDRQSWLPYSRLHIFSLASR